MKKWSTFFAIHICELNYSDTSYETFVKKPQTVNHTIVFQMHHLPTCSLTEARMAEVVSVSDPSPLDVFNTGLREFVLSEDEGWSGTGIVSAVHGKTNKRLDLLS